MLLDWPHHAYLDGGRSPMSTAYQLPQGVDLLLLRCKRRPLLPRLTLLLLICFVRVHRDAF